MNTQKLRIAVLFGGNSNEREISLDSGRNIIYKLSAQKYEVTPLFVTDAMELFVINQALLVRNSTKEIVQGLDQATKIRWHDLPRMTDFVFIGLHGGFGENGAVQGALEMLNLPYNGSSILTSALCMDKYKTTQFLRSRGIEVPQSLLIAKKDWISSKESMVNTIVKAFTLPVIVKPHDDGCSVMVQKIQKTEQLTSAIDSIFANGKEYLMVEEFITGMELTVGVIGNQTARALPPSQAIVNGNVLSIEEKFLPGAGENQTPAPLPDAALSLVQRTMEQAYTALQCKGYARIDCFYQTAQQSPTGNERVIIIEVNTLPGLTPATCIFHQAAEIGMKPMDFIDLIVQLGLQEHAASATMQQNHFQVATHWIQSLSLA
ncbi:MAG TPA: ATP-grasp domain-containing protein [Candidatus Babeliales bacterium]|nr:ATP-grasp domain-containing protein [Candidatus Babeliales bacterium]